MATLPYLAKANQKDGKGIEFCPKLERTKITKVICFTAQQRFFMTRVRSPSSSTCNLHQRQKVHSACSSDSRQVRVLSFQSHSQSPATPLLPIL
ncbi:hypothetical protein EUGRSUZ_F03228 [Eucalyptus grandis]|uniref:Uncharacterized protein n=2 Tax=Eucalyptus grandis TaxID=71139 RepID=A0ACC3KMZ4_EUCGR|nr:hypothetical protein EUGRSUZ_F03228 [Eucalyptus grandis]